MTYDSHVSGEFEIDPPLLYSELRDSPFKFHSAPAVGAAATWRAPGVVLDLTVEMREQLTEDGEDVTTTYAGVRLSPQPLNQRHPDDLVDHMQDVLNMFDSCHEWKGQIEVEGDGGGWGPEVWRLTVKDGTAKKIPAVLMYPETVNETIGEALESAAKHIENLPRDPELDPGRGESVTYLRSLIAPRHPGGAS